MQIKVGFQNIHTGEVRQVKVGWSWVLFFFSTFLGLPLFLRGLVTWGAMYAGFSVLNMIGSLASSSAGLSLSFVGLALCIFMGVKGNEITAKSLLSQGWLVKDADSEITRIGLARWGITDTSGFAVPRAPDAAHRA